MSLVRVSINGYETNVGEAFAEAKGLTVLDEPTHNLDGSVRVPHLSPQKKAAITRATNESTDGNKSSAKQAAKPAKTAEEAN